MASAKVKKIHLIKLKHNCRCKVVCDNYFYAEPIEATIVDSVVYSNGKGTFNPKRVTCKRCLKHRDYKVALDKVNNPLFYWREKI